MKIISALCVFSIACVDISDEQLSEDRSSLIAANALLPSELWGTSINANQLTTANAESIAVNQNGKRTLKYLVMCALGSSQSISGNVASGGTFNFTGQLALATSWPSAALTSAEQQIVSACVLALTNQTGDAVTVSVRGPGLGLQGSEGTDYQIQEGAFWGNLFLGGSKWAATCNGVHQAANDTYADLPKRECAEAAANCSFTYAGLCATACTTGGVYSGCSDGSHGAATDVVTAYLAGTPM